MTTMQKTSSLALSLALAAGAVSVRTAGPAGEWRAYGSDNASSRYSAADQITASNVRNLKVVWRQSTTPEEVKAGRTNVPPPPTNNETTPLMVGGLVYFSTAIGGVAALDAATGKVI